MNQFRNIFILLLTIFVCEIGLAASVVKVNKKKKLVTIDEGKISGIKKKTKICFMSPSGKKIVCGKVKKVKKNSAKVKIKSKKKIKKIKLGFTAEIMGGRGGSSGGGSGKKFLAIRALGMPAIMSQTVYNKLIYSAPDTEAETDTVETLWAAEEVNSQAVSSGGLEFDLLKVGIALGVRVLRSYQQFKAESDYSKANEAQFVTSSITGSAFGVYLDYYFMKPKSNKPGLRVGAGIDFDISTVTLKVIQQEDEVEGETELYNVTSKLNVISLRVPVNYDMPFGGLGINAGINLLIPLVGDTAAITADTNDANTDRYVGADADEKTVNAQADLLKSMAHTKGSFGLEVIVGIYFAL